MAHDDGRRGRRHEREQRGPEWRGPEWRGEDGFGGGWGNQVPRPHRSGDGSYRGPADDSEPGPYYGEGGGWYGPDAADGDYRYGGPGLDSAFTRPRFERADPGGAGGHGVHPVAAAFGPGYGLAGGMFGSSTREFRGEAGQRHDPHYAEWRQRQMTEFDRDYDEYARENQSRFDREFGEWRRRRGEQRAAVGRIREHMDVTGSDGGHVGTVDCTRGDRVVLTRSDEASGGVHHVIPCAWIDKVEDKVVLNIEAGEARRRWETENRSRALFEREDRGRRGPHMLNRSFAGTYSDEE
jgi:hypothetical protein